MWTLVSLATISASLVLVLRMLRPFRGDLLTILAIGLIWLRFALTSLGDIAHRSLAADQSLLAIGTLAATIGILLVVPIDRFRTSRVLPFFGLLGLIVLSGLLNGQIGALVSAVVLWVMFIACALLLHRAFEVHGPKPVLRALIAVFLLPIAMQGMSLAFGRAQVGMDGSIGYVGNYAHGSVFAIVALTALWLVNLFPWARSSALFLAFGLGLAALVLANYRTLILAALPLLVVFAVQMASAGKHLRRAALPMAMPVVLGTLLLASLPLLSSDRFAEIGTVLNEFGNLIKPPQEYTAADKDLLSARGYIAARYMYDFVEGGLVQQIVGFGPDAQARGIGVHPHNEYLRFLFEFGLLGLFLWLTLLLGHIVMALRYIPHPIGMAVASGYVAILIGSLGTSFFNRPEGMIMFSVLCSMTWYLAEWYKPTEPRFGTLPMFGRKP